MTTTTQTAKCRARIFPSTAQQIVINSTQRTVAGKLEIKWDGLSWSNESTYFVSAKGNWTMEGDLGEGLASQADFELENTTLRFLPENIASPIYSYLRPRRQIRFYVVIGGVNYLLFTGYIKAIEPDRKSGMVNLHCFDNAEKVMNVSCPRTAYTDYYTHELMQILGVAAGINVDTGMALENSRHLVRAAYFGDRNIWPVMGELAVAERGRVFFDIDGILRFWGRDHIQEQARVTTLTRATHLEQMEFTVEEQHIKNRVTVKARPRASAGIQPVWTNGGALALNQYTEQLVWIPAGGTQYAYMDITDAYDEALPCTDWIRPVATTDYEANSAADGTGTDYTGSITINSFITYADACYLEVQNHAPVDIYFTRFQVRANPLQIWKWISIRQEDEWSVAEYGVQEIAIENNFIDDEQMANDIAEVEVKRWKNAKNGFKATILGVPYLQIGDVVGLEVSSGTYEDYMIYSINWDVDTKGFMQELEFVDKIHFPITQTLDCGADIKRMYAKTVSCKANLGTATKTAITKAMITDFTLYKKTTTTKGNILGTKTLTCKASIT